jgi:hypothetical protein
MGMVITTVITCDNEKCPGNDLDPSDLKQWISVMASIPGKSGGIPQQFLFCSSECLSVTAGDTEQEALTVPPEPVEEAKVEQQPTV